MSIQHPVRNEFTVIRNILSQDNQTIFLTSSKLMFSELLSKPIDKELFPHGSLVYFHPVLNIIHRISEKIYTKINNFAAVFPKYRIWTSVGHAHFTSCCQWVLSLLGEPQFWHVRFVAIFDIYYVRRQAKWKELWRGSKSWRER